MRKKSSHKGLPENDPRISEEHCVKNSLHFLKMANCPAFGFVGDGICTDLRGNDRILSLSPPLKAKRRGCGRGSGDGWLVDGRRYSGPWLMKPCQMRNGKRYTLIMKNEGCCCFLFEVVGDLVECVLFVHPDEGEKMKDESKRCLKFYRGPEKMPGNVRGNLPCFKTNLGWWITCILYVAYLGRCVYRDAPPR